MPNFKLNDSVFIAATEKFQTPFHLYDEQGIIDTIKKLKKAFSPAPFKEYFAVKALPNPAILKIVKENGCGVDCASLAELMLAEACGFSGDDIMFSANTVPDEEFAYARKLGAIINLDDISHIDALHNNGGIPETICLRFNPGGIFMDQNDIMGSPGQSKYGMTRDQLTEALIKLKKLGAKRFGLHAFLVSNTRESKYYPELAALLMKTGIILMDETGLQLDFLNLSGGIGIPYHKNETEADIDKIGEGVNFEYQRELINRGVKGVKIFSELGRYLTGPHGWLVTKAIRYKDIYKQYIGVDASACDLMRPAMYGAYHYIGVVGKGDAERTEVYDVVGSLCENNDKFAIDRKLPKIDSGDILVIHDTGAHSRAMGYNYNGKMRCGEVLYTKEGNFKLIRRSETPKDYFATLDIYDDEAIRKLAE